MDTKRRRTSSSSESENVEPKKEKHSDEVPENECITGNKNEENRRQKNDRTRCMGDGNVVKMLISKALGNYISPTKLKSMKRAIEDRLRSMQHEISDKNGDLYQWLTWEILKEKIEEHINNVNSSNFQEVARELIYLNVLRGRGLFVKYLILAQREHPENSETYSKLACVVNCKLGTIGELLLARLISTFKREFHANNKNLCILTVTFLAHLINIRFTHEVLILEILRLLLESLTADSIELIVIILKECGVRLIQINFREIDNILQSLKKILREQWLDERSRNMIIEILRIHFIRYRNIRPLDSEFDIFDIFDIIQSDSMIRTHGVTLSDPIEEKPDLDHYTFDPDFSNNERIYGDIVHRLYR